jgi:hypothetical protein
MRYLRSKKTKIELRCRAFHWCNECTAYVHIALTKHLNARMLYVHTAAKGLSAEHFILRHICVEFFYVLVPECTSAIIIFSQHRHT